MTSPETEPSLPDDGTGGKPGRSHGLHCCPCPRPGRVFTGRNLGALPGWLTLGAILLLGACRGKDVFEPGWAREIGKVDPASSSVQMISAPATAAVNAGFTVTVRTRGSSSCTRVADTQIVVSGLNVDITPYDEFAKTMPFCTDDLKAFDHSAVVTVGTAGQARVRLHARTLAGADYTLDVPVTIQ